MQAPEDAGAHAVLRIVPNVSTTDAGRAQRFYAEVLGLTTAMDHTTKIVSRHSSGRLLYELADVVIDNGGVFGDATLKLPPVPDGRPSGAITATSSLTGALIAQMLVTEVCGLLLEAGQEVPILISANIPGGDVHNERLRQAYVGRVRSQAP